MIKEMQLVSIKCVKCYAASPQQVGKCGLQLYFKAHFSHFNSHFVAKGLRKRNQSYGRLLISYFKPIFLYVYVFV